MTRATQAPRTPGDPAPSAPDVQPFPGTPDAPAQTNVGFPALNPSQIASLRVIGSRSGRHVGHIVELPGGGGAAFIPSRPFIAGERVKVRANFSSKAAGAASGTHGATHLTFAFKIAKAVPGAPLVDASTAAPPNVRASFARRSARLTLSFHSARELHPPVAAVSGHDPDPGEGDIFTNPEDLAQHGPLILSPQGQLLYFGPTHWRVFNVQVQRYQNRPVLTYWVGANITAGCDLILNQQYEQIAKVCAGNGDTADAHEFQITPQGDALLDSYAAVKADLSSIGGPRHGTLIDSLVQEINIASGRVIWEWHASGHVPLRSTYAGKPGSSPYDFFHINSIQQLPGDKLLVSGRNTWAVYEIDMRTGKVTLVIGGKRSSFRMGPGANFEWQHDARMHSDGTLTVFDNASDGSVSNEVQSRALRIRLDRQHRRATLVDAYTNTPPVLSTSQGSVQLLHDGNTFIGWGAAAYFNEFSPTGARLFSVHFHSPPVRSYRGLRFHWSGQPTRPPAAALRPTQRGTVVYASWNGATDVQRWRVLAEAKRGALTTTGTFAKTSFETKMWVPSTAPYLAVEAIGRSGQVLGTSAPMAR